MIKLQDFAKERGVTDRQIQRLIKKYAEELEGLYERRGQDGTWLSEEACRILKSKMKTSQYQVVENHNEEEIERLKQEIDKLNQRLERKDVLIEKLQERTGKQFEEIEQLRKDTLLLEDKNKENKQLKKIIDDLTETEKINSEEIIALREENKQKDEALETEKSRKLSLSEAIKRLNFIGGKK